jgi:pyruvate formate lyase activating enzyme
MIDNNNSDSAVRAPVNRILRSSIVDGPGNRAAVFLQGCNYDCVYCHNPETITLCNSCGICVTACPAGALSVAEAVPGIRWEREKCALCDNCLKACPRNSSPRTRLMSPAEVMAKIEPSLAFIRGVTVSGGECTRHPNFLRALGGLAKDKSLTFFLDSNGSYDYAGDADLMAVTDAVMLDVKADPHSTEYSRVTGRKSGNIFAKMDFLAKAGKLWEVRTVVSPGLLDAATLVEKVCILLAKNAETQSANENAGPPRYKLIRYRPVGVRPTASATLAEPDAELMDSLAAICAKHGIKAEVV